MTSAAKSAERFPSMPLEAWADSKATLLHFLQIVGKIRLAYAPPRNHWWHVPFHLTGRGITTRPMGSSPIFAIDFDFVDHRLIVSTEMGDTQALSLIGQSVASYYEQTLTALADLGIGVVIERPEPYGLSDSIPFAEDTSLRVYDPFWVNRYWRILGQVNVILEEFAGRFSGKTSPVHHFWHSMDIAVTRFSDREVNHPPGVDWVTREAYSREVISFGFWFGDSSHPEPAFYSYTTPEPQGLASASLFPPTAEWLERGDGHLAILRYGDARATVQPAEIALQFFESAYEAGATLAGWDIPRLASPNGITVPRINKPRTNRQST
jgi:uncharacterized protein DUF5996